MLPYYLRFILLSLLSFILTLFLTLHPWLSVIAASPPIDNNTVNQSQQLEQAKRWYQEGKLGQAIEIWQELASKSQESGNKLEQARILTHLALAYSQLGAWKEAETAINDSLNLLEKETINNRDQIRLPILAEAFNVQGTLFFAKGDALSALNSWKKATNNYEKIQNKSGVFRTKINQARALQKLGNYPRACQKLLLILDDKDSSCTKIDLDRMEEKISIYLSSVTSLKIEHLISLAQVLSQLNKLDLSRLIFEKLLEESLPIETKATVLLNSGKTFQLQKKISEAQQNYQEALAISNNNQTQIKAQLALLKILITPGKWSNSETLSRNLLNQIEQLPLNRTKIDSQLNLAQLLINKGNPEIYQEKLPFWNEIEKLLIKAQENSQITGYKRGEIYSLGNLGQLYEKLALIKACNNYSFRQQNLLECSQTFQFQDIKELQDSYLQVSQKAQKFTEQALIRSQAIQAPEMTYLWQWQLGRILAKSDQKAAIKIYLAAAKTLKNISRDLGTNQEFQFSFQEKVEPLYRQLLSLLLPRNNQESVPLEQLEKARQQIEALQAAELNNFFQDICAQNEDVDIEEIDPQAAVIYPIILRDRFVVLLSLPGKPLQTYVSQVEQKKLEKTVYNFRYNIVIRSQREFFKNAQQLYDWLIRPFNQQLQQAEIKTLIFVPDGVFRNVPLSALYDGQQYLIENYGVSLTPGLTLLSPESLQKKGLDTLFAGLTDEKPQPGFVPLFYIKKELQAVSSQVPSTVLLNKKFTLNNLQENLENSLFPIVHFATHGQFSSKFEDTFLVTWDDKINILQLEQLLRESDPTQRSAIELLILSACETATGDRRAALGLAGFAVRAGARSTLATLWSINDQGTAFLMQQLYRQLATQKTSKVEALRQAQLTLLKNRWYKHPFYWSPYILVGNWL